MAVINATYADEPSEASGSKADAAPRQEVRLERVTPEYWRVTLDNPPYNIFGPETIPQLNNVIAQPETDPKVKVVVFQSAVPGFFLTHCDFVPPFSATTSVPPGVTGLPALPDILVRLSRAPVVSIVSIRGRTTGVGGELCRASDMRFASREKAVLSQWEIGAGLVPGGGPMARLPRLIGRGRALEILLGGDDISGDLAERYGYVNRALPDAELDPFVDALARRIAGFDKQAIVAIKRLVDIPTLPSDVEIGAEWDAFLDSAHRPQVQQNIKRLLEMGLQTTPDVEKRLPYYTGTLSHQARRRSGSPSRQATARRLAEPLERRKPTIYFVTRCPTCFTRRYRSATSSRCCPLVPSGSRRSHSSAASARHRSVASLVHFRRAFSGRCPPAPSGRWCSGADRCSEHLVVAAQMRLRTFRVIPVVNRSPSAKSPGVVPRPHRSAARVKATRPLLPAIAGCRVAVAAPAEPPGDATLPVSARQRLSRPRLYYRDGNPAAACLAGHAQSGPGAVAAPLELEQAHAGSAGGHPRLECTYLGTACRL
jgi:enoyl-CoA hydratase/carnithine racemase